MAPALIAAIPYITAAASAASAVGQYTQGKKASEAQEKTRDTQQAQQELQARRERLKMIREQRIKAAQIEAVGANVGAGSSSGVAGGVSSTQSQLGSNIQNLNANMALSSQITGYQQDAANAQSTSNLYGTIGGVAGNIFSDYGGYKTIFGGGK